LTHLFNVNITIKLIAFLSEYILMFNLCVFTRVRRMNKFMYRVLNADLPVIYIMVNAFIAVKYVIRHSVERAL